MILIFFYLASIGTSSVCNQKLIKIFACFVRFCIRFSLMNWTALTWWSPHVSLHPSSITASKRRTPCARHRHRNRRRNVRHRRGRPRRRRRGVGGDQVRGPSLRRAPIHVSKTKRPPPRSLLFLDLGCFETASRPCSARTWCAPARSSTRAASAASPARPAAARSSLSAPPSLDSSCSSSCHSQKWVSEDLPDLGFCVSAIQVMGESRRKEEYICFPEHLCTCYSFFYDIVGRGEQLCVSVAFWPAAVTASESVHLSIRHTEFHGHKKRITYKHKRNMAPLQLQLSATTEVLSTEMLFFYCFILTGYWNACWSLLHSNCFNFVSSWRYYNCNYQPAATEYWDACWSLFHGLVAFVSSYGAIAVAIISSWLLSTGMLVDLSFHGVIAFVSSSRYCNCNYRLVTTEYWDVRWSLFHGLIAFFFFSASTS